MEDQEDMLSQIVRAIQEELEERLVAVVLFGSRAWGQVTGTWEALHRLLARHAGHRLAAVYEAGYFGFRLHDRLADHGIPCLVTPPSLVPQEMATESKPIGRDSSNQPQKLRFR